MAIAARDMALSKAKIGLMSQNNSVFFSTVCLSLNHIWDDTIKTACTDGESVWYNTDFFMELSPAARIGLILHETLHVVFTHMLREDDREHDRWNVACDHAINIIIDNVGITLPDSALLDHKKYKNKGAEEIYATLPEKTKMPAGAMQDLKNPGAGSDAAKTKERITAQIDDILIQASIQSAAQGDAPGTIPGETARHIDKLLNPIVPWFQILRSFMTKLAKTEYSFRKPNRRFFPNHILPSLHGEGMCDIAIAVDISGSVNQTQFECFISETAAIIKDLRPAKTTFMQFTTKIRAQDTITNLAELMDIKFAGTGGTDVNPVIAWAAETKPTCLIIFTDGYFPEIKINPHVPIIWIIYDNDGFKAPFGKTIHYQFKDKG